MLPCQQHVFSLWHYHCSLQQICALGTIFVLGKFYLGVGFLLHCPPGPLRQCEHDALQGAVSADGSVFHWFPSTSGTTVRDFVTVPPCRVNQFRFINSVTPVLLRVASLAITLMSS